MTALELLEEQHREVDSLIAKIEESEDTDERRQLFEKLADSVAAHSTIEEKLFYPSVRSEDTENLVNESYQEHLAVKRSLGELMDLEPDDEEFDEVLDELKEKLTHHAHEEEEGELFPKVRKMMSSEQLENLGNELLSLYEAEMASEPRMRVQAELIEEEDVAEIETEEEPAPSERS